MYVTFAELEPGDRFRFFYNPFTVGTQPRLSTQTYKKLQKRDWYADEQEKKWRTGRKVAVVKVG